MKTFVEGAALTMLISQSLQCGVPSLVMGLPGAGLRTVFFGLYIKCLKSFEYPLCGEERQTFGQTLENWCHCRLFPAECRDTFLLSGMQTAACHSQES